MVYCTKCGNSDSTFDTVCSVCGSPTTTTNPKSNTSENSGVLPFSGANFMAGIGVLLAILGISCAVYFMFCFGTTNDISHTLAQSYGVPSDTPVAVNNIGLISDKQSGLTFGFGTAIFGLLLFHTNRRS